MGLTSPPEAQRLATKELELGRKAWPTVVREAAEDTWHLSPSQPHQPFRMPL